MTYLWFSIQYFFHFIHRELKIMVFQWPMTYFKICSFVNNLANFFCNYFSALESKYSSQPKSIWRIQVLRWQKCSLRHPHRVLMSHKSSVWQTPTFRGAFCAALTSHSNFNLWLQLPGALAFDIAAALATDKNAPRQRSHKQFPCHRASLSVDVFHSTLPVSICI